MEFDKNIPIYIQIMDEIKRRVIAGVLHPGDKVPSVRELAEELKVNPNTIVRAFQELERAGITETRRGMGTFISEGEGMNAVELKAQMGQAEAGSFVARMREAGISDDEIIRLVTAAVNQKVE